MDLRKFFALIPPRQTMHISTYDYGVEMRMTAIAEINMDGHPTSVRTVRRTIGKIEVDRNPALDYIVEMLIKEMVQELDV